MASEEDTFNRLKRVSLEEFRHLRWEYHFHTLPLDIPEEFFKKYGWTRDEFLKAMADLGYKRYAEL